MHVYTLQLLLCGSEQIFFNICVTFHFFIIWTVETLNGAKYKLQRDSKLQIRPLMRVLTHSSC